MHTAVLADCGLKLTTAYIISGLMHARAKELFISCEAYVRGEQAYLVIR